MIALRAFTASRGERFAVTRNELTARGGVMEGEISVQQTPCAVIQGELTAKARDEACAAKIK